MDALRLRVGTKHGDSATGTTDGRYGEQRGRGQSAIERGDAGRRDDAGTSRNAAGRWPDQHATSAEHGRIRNADSGRTEPSYANEPVSIAVHGAAAARRRSPLAATPRWPAVDTTGVETTQPIGWVFSSIQRRTSHATQPSHFTDPPLLSVPVVVNATIVRNYYAAGSYNDRRVVNERSQAGRQVGKAQMPIYPILLYFPSREILFLRHDLGGLWNSTSSV